jgi:hypothetical protein
MLPVGAGVADGADTAADFAAPSDPPACMAA